MAEVWTPPVFDDVATDEFVTAAQLNAFGNSLRFLARVGYQEFTGDVSVTATTVGTANQIVSAGAITYEAVPHEIQFFCPFVAPGAQVCHVILRDSTTVLGRLGIVAASGGSLPMFLSRTLTPTAAAHTYNIAGWNAAAATTTFNAGSGGAAGDGGADFAGYIKVVRIPT